MTRNCKSLLMLLALTGFIAGCSVQGEVTDMTQKITIIQAGNLAGFVASAKQGETTFGGYKVYSASGLTTTNSPTPGIYQKTSGGYKVYTTVQGNNSSETISVHIE